MCAHCRMTFITASKASSVFSDFKREYRDSFTILESVYLAHFSGYGDLSFGTHRHGFHVQQSLFLGHS